MTNRVAGGGLPQPPHHPACGSAPGGSIELPGRENTLRDVHDKRPRWGQPLTRDKSKKAED